MTIRAGNQQVQYQEVSLSSSSTTIRFTVPDGADTVDIQAAMVIPEFEVIALLVLAASIVGVIGFTRLKGNALSGLGFGQQVWQPSLFPFFLTI